ncbi:SIS domain-containing protein [Photorhabdus laumondii subsp. laumondii]|uniref:Photorhabdus luminescens subsp. laumondii TTO1 complete genome segment 7/17 n=2 Tax=Photorhabdus laumondii subsp. laumondii TaxID=141679 RepID=Q7N5X2_PHOLL|nr:MULTISPECIES: MurR/RpiR family transcriptional regulator [Photorhabdus]AWK41631.1 Fe-S cluster assembly protein HesB [Photorhabdus laumondii subsp. laumondii]AXG42469.1 MurR/RpiR family transcriptional regulator [Photorhabdus laumondii subsp. laumondii]AXG46955.1 MurR/RpiR family transcriptional regulator [Photorhabdus laumondii subsp. laumondii]KTL60428.1 Fe-S cluster assembly protein HesB [Photorhabdus laumondii subsp. laumondii]MCC8384412.1 MurR/RpiR family transcriptional regulator [Pho
MSVASNLNEFQEQVRSRYSGLSKRLQQVARYVLDNTNSVAFDTVAVIAREADVPPSTLIRFANAFDFSGFNEMKQLFRMHMVEETASYADRARLFRELDGEQEPPEDPQHILQEFARSNVQAMQQLAARTAPEDLRNAVDLLAQAKNIYIIGLRRSFSVAAYLSYALNHLECRPLLVDGLGGMFREQINLIGEEDVVVSISFTPYAEETLMVSERAAKAGAKQIVITDSQISPLASFSDVCFVVKEAQVEAFRSQSATLCLVQSLAVSLAYRQGNTI